MHIIRIRMLTAVNLKHMCGKVLIDLEGSTTHKCPAIDDTVSMIHNRMDVFNIHSVIVESL